METGATKTWVIANAAESMVHLVRMPLCPLHMKLFLVLFFKFFFCRGLSLVSLFLFEYMLNTLYAFTVQNLGPMKSF